MPTVIEEAVAATLAAIPEPQRLPLIPTRYPFRYAYDFVKERPEVIGATAEQVNGDRCNATGLVTDYAERTGQNRGDVVKALADGYLSKYDIDTTGHDLDELMAQARREFWKSTGDARP